MTAPVPDYGAIDQAKALADIVDKFAQPPAELVSKLPKGKRDDSKPKINCNVCGTYHQQGFIHLDFVGHGDITLMLIAADPMWTWEPLAYAPDGGPMTRRAGPLLEMWGKLTVHGVTRIGVGTCEASKDESAKELIGDFLRNAAMRFGFCTKLWSKTAGMPDMDDEPAAPPATASRPATSAAQSNDAFESAAPARPPAQQPARPVNPDPPTGGLAPPPEFNLEIYEVLDGFTPSMVANFRAWAIEQKINLRKAPLTDDELIKVTVYLQTLVEASEAPVAHPPGQEPF